MSTGPAESAPALAVEALAKSFGGVAAVDGVSLEVAAGTRVALIGPNGAGKSTLFNMINGQLRPDRGRVAVAGRDVTGLPPHRVWRHGVARTFQITATFASMTLAENVQTALIAHHGRARSLWPRAAALYRDAAEALLGRVGLAEQAWQVAGELAYGDLKRLELAVALANEPHLMLMDEPTAGMAAGERGALMDTVSAVVAERGIAVLFTEHDMDVVFGHADRVLVLDRGRLIAAGDPETVRADPTVRSVYLGSAAVTEAPRS
jgi:branched-chain amino acid transport system ATP-binding protein